MRILSIFFLAVSSYLQAYTVDKVLAIVYTPGETNLILQSDLRPGIDGAPKTLETVVLESLMLADAKSLKMTVSEAEIDRYLAKVEEQHKLTREQTKELFKNMGYSYTEARNQLHNMQMVEQIKEHRIRSKVLVGKQEIEKYYKEHPKYEEATYTITQGFIPFAGGSPSIKKAMIQDALESGTIDTMVQWTPPVELKESDFAQDKAYIKELQPGAVTQLKETEEGITVIQLVAKKPQRLVPLEECKKEIAAFLSKDRLDAALAGYKNKLLASSPYRVKYIERVTVPA